MGLFYLTAHHVKPGLEKNGTFRGPRREKKKEEKKGKNQEHSRIFQRNNREIRLCSPRSQVDI